MLLGIEVGLAPGDIVLDGDPAPPKRGTAALPHFSAVLWPNGWVDQDPTWYEGRPPATSVVSDDPSSLQKGVSSPLLFGPCLWQTVAHLSYC